MTVSITLINHVHQKFNQGSLTSWKKAYPDPAFRQQSLIRVYLHVWRRRSVGRESISEHELLCSISYRRISGLIHPLEKIDGFTV
jgi:hypothetical protein